MSFCGGPGAFGVPADGVETPFPLPVFDPNEFVDASAADEAFDLFELKLKERNVLCIQV